jgi:putative endonuclease
MLKWIKPNTKQKGDYFESVALKYLSSQGLILHTSNFHSRFGEVDIIMTDQDCLVFIEVKYRTSDRFGSPFEQVSVKKQQKIIKTAQLFLQKHSLSEYNTKCRFDVVSLIGTTNNPKITWLKNAFYGA